MAAGVVIGGVASGVGKTTVTAGLAAALRHRGLRVQPYKAGPDYLDPTHLSAFSGRACRNLDTWMLPAAHVRELFVRALGDADVALVEGVMGLHDGRSGTDGAGSTASLARLLRLPVVLVVDASAMARSAAAIVLGYQQLDPELRFAGVILNRVAGAGHAEMCTSAIEEVTGLPVFGWLPRDAEIALPERHLGLTPALHGPPPPEVEARLVALVEAHVDVGGLLARLADMASVDTTTPRRLFPALPVAARVRVAIASDEAFHFYYQDSLDLLEAWGADLLPFSPLTDIALPPAVDAILLGGGFPELAAEQLAANAPMLDAIRDAAGRGTTIYGECGGLMYLGERLTGFDGTQHSMLGLIRASSVMTTDRLSLGYREVSSRGTPFLPRGESVRGHEFHWSSLETPAPEEGAAYRVLGESARPEGFRVGSVTATYVHLHLGARADLAPTFVESVARGRAE